MKNIYVKSELENSMPKISNAPKLFSEELHQSNMDFICGKSLTKLFERMAEKMIEKTAEESNKYVGQKTFF